MTTQDLIEKLKVLPADMEVVLMQTDDEYSYSDVNTVEVRLITFKADDIPKKEWPKINCVLISDEF